MSVGDPKEDYSSRQDATDFILLHGGGLSGQPWVHPLLSLERFHINNKAIFHVGLHYPRVGFANFLNVDHLDIRNDVMLGTETKHFLCLFYPAYQRTCNISYDQR